MSKRSAKTSFVVEINGVSITTQARSPGAAVRTVVRDLIREKVLKRQPVTLPGGGFKGVKVKLAEAIAA